MNADIHAYSNPLAEPEHGDAGLRILLVDDHELLRHGLKHFLADALGDVVFGEAGSAAEALELAREETWDLLLLDLHMPGPSGMDVLAELRARESPLRVLVFSVSPEEECAVRALKQGARGYINKHTAPGELLAAIRKVLAGGRYISPRVAEQLASDLGSPVETELHTLLSQRELQVLRLIASGESVKEIALRLHLSGKTVFTYRDRLRDKLGLKNDVEIARYALRHRLVE